MILATPFHPSFTDYADYAKILTKRGPLLNHIHLVVTTKHHQDAAYDFGEEVSGLFLRSFNVVLPELDRTRIGTANDMLRSALRFATNYQHGTEEIPDPALLYNDPSYRPAKSGWLDTIQAEYYLKNAPTVFGDSSKAEDGSKIFKGPVVFAKDFPKKSGLLDFVPSTVHWRIHLRWELANLGVDTKLIGVDRDAILRLKAAPKDE